MRHPARLAGGPGEAPGRAAAAASVALVVVTGLVVALVAWAAASGPDRVLISGVPARTGGTPTPSEPVGHVPVVEPRGVPGDHPWLTWLAVLVELALAAAALALVLWLLARLVRGVALAWRRRVGRPGPAEVAFDLLDERARLSRALAVDAADQRDALEEGVPRNAIVACWHRFEQQAGLAGVHRRPAETSAEFTLRVLDLVDADPAAVTTLAGLYREARFSRHPMGEDHRRRALAALDAVHHGLLSRAASRATPPEEPA